MHSHYGKTSSLWMRQHDVPQYPALNRDIETDVCIIGAGVSGLSAAYMLAAESTLTQSTRLKPSPRKKISIATSHA